jgi:hypothetical protein
MKLSYLILSIAALFLFSLTAFAGVESVKVGGDITSYGYYKDNTDFTVLLGDKTNMVAYYGMLDPGTRDTGTDDLKYMRLLARVYFAMQLSDDVEVYTRLKNDRRWGAETTTDTNTKLNNAFVKIHNFKDLPLTATIGRQDVHFGPLIEDSNVLNGDQGEWLPDDPFDAILLEYSLGEKVGSLDFFYSKISETIASKDDVDLYAARYRIKALKYQTIDNYFILKRDLSDSGTNKKLYVYGIFAEGALSPQLFYKTGAGYQWGRYDDTGRQKSAFAALMGAKYVFKKNYKPFVGMSYTYFSGEKSTDTGTHKGFSVLYGGNELRAAQIFSVGTNLHVIKSAFGFSPTKNTTFTTNFCNFRLVNPFANNTAYYTTNRDAGREIDADLAYSFNKDLSFKLGYYYLFAGRYLQKPYRDASRVIAGEVKLTF